MIILSEVTNSVLQAAKRFVDMVCTGKKDIRSVVETGPYGFDSAPIPGVRAVYVDTIGQQNITVGYIGKNQKAQPGESRMYSTDTGGVEKYFVYCYADKVAIGTGTPAKHFTRYEDLDTVLQDQITKINTQLDAIATAIGGLGGSYVPVHIVEDFSSAKTDNILTNYSW
jgi:hypothetical protein